MFRLRAQAAAALLLIAAQLARARAAFAGVRADHHRLVSVSQPRAAAAADLYRTLPDLDAQHAKSLVVTTSSRPCCWSAGMRPRLAEFS